MAALASSLLRLVCRPVRTVVLAGEAENQGNSGCILQRDLKPMGLPFPRGPTNSACTHILLRRPATTLVFFGRRRLSVTPNSLSEQLRCSSPRLIWYEP